MFSLKFLKNLAEDAVVAFVVTAGGILAVTDGDLGRAALVGAATAGLRSVLGVLVKNVGAEESTRLSK